MPNRQRRRGFTLLELMMVVAILGILATLAVPNLLPAVRKEALRAAGHAVAGFMTQARLTAMAEKRCVRVRVDTTNSSILVAERLNAYDCENPSAPLIIAGKPLWQEFSRSRLDKGSFVITLDPAPSDTADEIRFRPNGRVFSADDDLTDDDGVLVITNPNETTLNKVQVLVDAATMICTFPADQLPPGTGNNRSCP